MATFNFRSVLASALVAATTMTVAGRTLTANEALNRAIGLDSRSAGMMQINSGSSAPELVYTEETEGEATVYVFNKQDGGAWIVAANDAVPNGLLGYTDNGGFNVDNMPDNVAGVLYQYGLQVSYAAQAQNSLVRNQKLSRSVRGAVEPLMKTCFGQTGYYNTLTPTINGKQTPTGCVATAMAQVMMTYRYPACGTGSISYKPAAMSETLSYDFSSNPINWDAIEINRWGEASDAAGRQAVAELMLTCGMATKMNYNVGGSGSSLTNASRGMVDYLGYDRGCAVMDRDYFDAQSWDEMLYNELSEGRAVIYSGRSDYEGGHCFVIDGYNTDGYYHVNWGWAADFDGYYLLSALDPRGNGKGFNYAEQMIVGLQPRTEANAIRPVLQYNGDVTVEKTEVSRTTAATVKVKAARGIFNQSVDAVTITFGLHLIGTDGTELYVPATSSKTMTRGGGATNYIMNASSFPTTGRYLATPAVRTTEGEWNEVQTQSTAERALYVDCSSSTLVFTPESEMISNESLRDIIVSDVAIREGSINSRQAGFGLQANFSNTSYNYYVKSLTPTLMDANGNVVATATQFTVELEALENEMAELNCSLNGSVADGTYTMALVDNKGKTFGAPIAVKVLSDQLQGVEEIAAEAASSEILTTEIYATSGRLMATVEGADTASANLTAGIYILRHLHADGTATTTKQAIR